MIDKYIFDKRVPPQVTTLDIFDKNPQNPALIIQNKKENLYK